MNNLERLFLDTEKVGAVLVGYKKTFLYSHMQVSRAVGSMLLNHGILPIDDETRSRALNKLSEITRLPIDEMLVTLTAKGSAA